MGGGLMGGQSSGGGGLWPYGWWVVLAQASNNSHGVVELAGAVEDFKEAEIGGVVLVMEGFREAGVHFGNWVVGLNGTKMPENYFFSTCRQAPFPSDDHLAPYSLARWNTAALPWGPATLPKSTAPLLRSVYLSHSFLYFYPISLFINIHLFVS